MGAEYIAAAQFIVTVLATQQQQEAQRQQVNQANRIAQENARLANIQYQNQIAQINEKNRRIKAQENNLATQATDTQLDEQVKALQAQGTAITATGEAGVEGASPYLQLQDIEKQQLKNIGAIRGNYDVNMNNLQFQRKGLEYEADNAYYNALSRVNSNQGAFGQSGFANALQYATAGVDAGTTYYKLGGRFNKDDKKTIPETYIA